MENTRTAGKRLPAYGRQLLEALKSGREPFHGISLWIDREASLNGVCAPLGLFRDADPAMVDWSLCRNRSVMIPHAEKVDPDRLSATIAELKKYDPERVITFSENPPSFEIVFSRELAE